MPPKLTGRDAELGIADRLIHDLAAGRPPPQDLLLFGPRGNGKTVLLARIASIARDRGMRVEDFPLSEMEDRPGLVRLMQQCAGRSGARVTGASLGAFGITSEPGLREEDIQKLLFVWIRREPAPLVIVADELHAVKAAVGASFLNAVQAAKREELPFLLVAAGTPDTPSHLRNMGTHNERGFEQVRIGRLDRVATVTALADPAATSGRPFTPDAVHLVAEESQDYPYFIQLLGSTVWEVGEHGGAARIAEPEARSGIATAREKIARFYGDRYMEAVKHRVDAALGPVLALVSGNGGQVGYEALRSVLRSVASGNPAEPDEVALLETLSDLGVIWETVDDRWEAGIPSFARYVLKRRASAKPPG